MPSQRLLPRLAAGPLAEAMRDSPVVLIHGPRQSGKSTLAMQHGARIGYQSLTFDDTALLNLAQSDPAGFVADLPDRVILDEVQRVPGLFLSLKMAVDRDRTPGASCSPGRRTCCCYPRSPTHWPAARRSYGSILLRSANWRRRAPSSSSG